jgi:hypothetical protein
LPSAAPTANNRRFRSEASRKRNLHFRLRKADKPAIKRQKGGRKDRAKRLTAVCDSSCFPQFSLGSIVIAGPACAGTDPFLEGWQAGQW